MARSTNLVGHKSALPLAAAWHAVQLALHADQTLRSVALAAEAIIFVTIFCGGFYTLQPNEAAAITLFSNYKGTDRSPGAALGLAVVSATQDFVAGSQCIQPDAQGERQARQPDRDRR